jgi:hypothetical protein
MFLVLDMVAENLLKCEQQHGIAEQVTASNHKHIQAGFGKDKIA